MFPHPAALAAPTITDESIAELEHYIEIMGGKVESELNTNAADAAFHNCIHRATNNHAIIFAIESMWQMRTEAAKLQIAYDKMCDRDNSHRKDEHQAIIEALRARDRAAARRAMRAHFTSIIEALLGCLKPRHIKRQAAESRSRYMAAIQLI